MEWYAHLKSGWGRKPNFPPIGKNRVFICWHSLSCLELLRDWLISTWLAARACTAPGLVFSGPGLVMVTNDKVTAEIWSTKHRLPNFPWQASFKHEHFQCSQLTPCSLRFSRRDLWNQPHLASLVGVQWWHSAVTQRRALKETSQFPGARLRQCF